MLPSAGEIDQFVYCPHNWWLAKQGVDRQSEGSRRGIHDHEAKGAALSDIERAKRDYRAGIVWSFRILLVAASITLVTMELFAARERELHIPFMTTALVLLSLSTGMLVIALDAQRRYKATQREKGVIPGELVDSDMSQEAKLLTDPEWDLSGRPDYVLETEGGMVPVEVKTGNTPPKPYESHVMQVATYLRLLEVSTHRRPEYGLITYPEGVFRVDWNEQNEQKLRDTVARIEAARAAGKADRDHNHKGRCLGCARRGSCDQRLA